MKIVQAQEICSDELGHSVEFPTYEYAYIIPGMMYTMRFQVWRATFFFLLIVPAASRGCHWCRERSGCLPRALDFAVLLGFVVLDIQAQPTYGLVTVVPGDDFHLKPKTKTQYGSWPC